MAKTYDDLQHSHVTVQHPDAADPADIAGDAWAGTFEILLVVDDRVWLAASYSHLGHAEVRQVGDGKSNGFDAGGNCIVSVPLAWCQFFTLAEAESIERMRDADARLLSYAR